MYYCDTHNCFVNELPCPYCGDDDHEPAVDR